MNIKSPYTRIMVQYVMLVPMINRNTGEEYISEESGIDGREVVSRTMHGFFNISLMKCYLYKQRLYYDREESREGVWFRESREYTLMPGESFDEKYLKKGQSNV